MRVNLVISLPDNATEADAYKAVRRALEGSDTILAPNTSVKHKGVRVVTKAGSISDARTWAKSQGIPVGKRGRLPQSVIDQFNAAN